jgi:hypothetical protein
MKMAGGSSNAVVTAILTSVRPDPPYPNLSTAGAYRMEYVTGSAK